ncbi:MAG: hypothetical protein ACK504_04510 [Bacteroidota bacterium]|jgi:hypothetical protein
MKKSFLRNSFLVGLTFALFSFDTPTAWFNAGNIPNSYEMGIEKGAGQNGKNAATIKSIDKKIDGFGTLMQQCVPDKYLGKRIKMTAFVKTENVKNWAGLWLRVDQAGSNQPLSFDNMSDRPIKGSTNWTEYEIILDVPNNASLIAYGALLVGTGQIWFDNITFKIVSDFAPSTSSLTAKKFPTVDEPTNLDFEK